MGYRSDLLIKISHEQDEGLKPYLADFILKPKPWVKEVRDLIKKHDLGNWGPTDIVLRIEGWEWYESYAEVVAIITMWDHFELFNNVKEHDHIIGCFIRIGEESGDVDITYINDGYELGGVSTSIEEY